MTQDARGFLWIADLNDGLIRYDGYEFRAYRHDPRNPRSISSNEVRFVYVDPTDTLWVGTGNGLNRYDSRSDEFERITTNSKDPAGLSHDGISFILVDSVGRLWVGTEYGLNQLQPGTTKFKQYHVEQGVAWGALNPDMFWSVLEDSSGRLWFGSGGGGGLLRYEENSDSLQQFLYARTVESPPFNSVRSIIEDRSGTLWFVGEHGIAALDAGAKDFRRVYFRSPVEDTNQFAFPNLDLQFWSIREDSSGRLWITTRSSGIFRVSDDRTSWIHLTHDPADPSSLSGNNVWSSFVDESQQVWFTNVEEGLSRYNPYADVVDELRLPQVLANSHALVTHVRALPDGLLLVGTPQSGAWTVDPGTRNWKALPWPVTSEARAAHQLWVTPTGTIWISSRSTLFEIDSTRTRTTVFEKLRNSNEYLFDRSGKHWFASAPNRNISRLDRDSGEIVSWAADPDEPTSLGHMFTGSMYEDSRGRFWVGSYRGLDLMDRKSGTFKHYDPDPASPDKLPGGDVNHIVEDDAGTLWIKSTGGISRYVDETDGFETYKPATSPIDIHSRGNLHGQSLRANALWWPSPTGVTSFNFEDRSFRTYGVSQGIPIGVSDLAFMADGRIAMALGDRIGLIHPEFLQRRTEAPKVVLTALQLGNQSVLPGKTTGKTTVDGTPWTATTLTLPHDHAALSIEFAAMHFADAMQNSFAYRLEGIQDEWINVSARSRRATFTSLPPGTFEFQVKAANPEGVWNETGATLHIKVLPPWWRTWWAYALYVSALLSAFVIVSLWRTRALRQHAATLELQVRSRTKELSDQKALVEEQASRLGELVDTKDRLIARISHEFRTPLTVLLGPIDRVQSEATTPALQNYLATAKRNASRLLRLVDQLLGLARMRSGHAEAPRPVAAMPIIRQVLASFESLAAERGLDLQAGSVADLTLHTTADALEKIVVNLVSNAIKFSPSGAAIRVSLEPGSAGTGILSVSDTGRGISADRFPHIFEPFERGHDEAERIPGSGLGLALVRELAIGHGGRVEVQSAVHEGSVFRVELPLAQSADAGPTAATWHSEAGQLEAASLRSETARPQVAPVPSAPGVSLFVIEDNADMQAYLQQVLKDSYHLEFAADGDSGLKQVRAKIPDLVICDIMLPGKDGYEVCHALKTDDRTSHIPVILLTALEDRDNRLKGLTEKADDYLTKPFDETELRQRIANLLDLRAMLQRRFARDLRFDDSPPADLSQRDQSFLQRLARVAASHHADPEFDLARLASAMAVGERHLQRKLHALVGLTPGEYLRAYRLQRALERLRAGERPGDVAIAVGFSSQAYFSTCFRTQFGFPPSDTRERMKQP